MKVLQDGLVKEFDVSPVDSLLYARVHVYRTLDLMRHSLWTAFTPSLRSYRYTFALAHDVADGPQFGDVWLSRTHVGVDTLSHEATHLALGLVRRAHLVGDEGLCYAVGSLTLGLIKGTQ